MGSVFTSLWHQVSWSISGEDVCYQWAHSQISQVSASLGRRWLGSLGSRPGFHYRDNSAPWDLEAGSGPWDQPLMALDKLATAQKDAQKWPKPRFAAGHSQRTVGWMETSSEIMLGLSCSSSLTVFLTSQHWLGTGGCSSQTYLWNDVC